MHPKAFAYLFVLSLTLGAHAAESGGLPDLSPLQLTRAEVARREQRLRPIFDYYGNTTAAQVMNALEGIYGLNVYHHIAGVAWPASALNQKKGIMAAAVQRSINFDSPRTQDRSWSYYRESPRNELLLTGVRYYDRDSQYLMADFNRLAGGKCDFTNSFNLSNGRVLSYREMQDLRDRVYNKDNLTRQDRDDLRSNTTCDVSIFKGLGAGDLLSQVPSSELGFVGEIGLGSSGPLLTLVKGKGDAAPLYRFSPFALQSEVVSAKRISMQGFDPLRVLSLGLLSNPFSGFESRGYSLYSSLTNPAVKIPQLYRFIAALNRLQFKALDATVVFTTGQGIMRGNETRPWQVIYPNFSTVAPIPQPIIFLSDSATDDDLDLLLRQEAPLILAYNKLFDAKLLPGMSRLQRALEKFSKQNPELQALIKKVGAENTKQALRRTFLSLAYGVLQTSGAIGQGVGEGTVAIARGVGQAASNIGEAIYDILDQETFVTSLMVEGPYGMITYTETVTN